MIPGVDGMLRVNGVAAKPVEAETQGAMIARCLDCLYGAAAPVSV